jgi:membrane-associated phospholipid phosphatase
MDPRARAAARLLALVALPLSAQLPEPRVTKSGDGTLWTVAGAAVLGALVLDRPIRSIAVANQSRALDHLANALNPLGTAGTLIPAIVVSYGLARLAHADRWSDAIVRVGLCYAAADVISAVLKPAVGRARPFVRGDPWRFRPFAPQDNYDSFPSAHVVHITSIGTAIAEQADRPWVTIVAGTAVTLVAAQRVYRDQHWTSDVVAGGVLSVATATATLRWLRRRSERRQPGAD